MGRGLKVIKQFPNGSYNAQTLDGDYDVEVPPEELQLSLKVGKIYYNTFNRVHYKLLSLTPNNTKWDVRAFRLDISQEVDADVDHWEELTPESPYYEQSEQNKPKRSIRLIRGRI